MMIALIKPKLPTRIYSTRLQRW